MLEYKEVKISDLNLNKNNPRINDAAAEKLVAGIGAYGFINPVVVNKRDNMVLAGHTRIKALKKLSTDTVPVLFVDMDETTARGFAIWDNKSAEFSKWDEDLVMKELEALSIEDFDIELTGFDINSLKEDPDISGGDEEPPEDKYQEQYGVIIMCESESDQEKVFNEMTEQGYNCRVVTT